MTDAAPSAGLAEQAHRLAERLDGEVGYVLHNLTTGERIVRAPDAVLPSASVIKWPVLTVLHELVADGEVAWGDVVICDHVHASGGSGVLSHLRPGLATTLGDLAWLMIAVSDNVATNAILDLIGLERVNRRMGKLIAPGLTVLRHAGTGSDAIGDSMGTATPAALARHVELLADGRLPGASETLELGRQELYRSGISRYLREPGPGHPGVRWATKSGSVAGVRNDVGLLETEDTRIVIVVMTLRAQESGLDVADPAIRAIARLTRAALRAWVDPELAP